MQGQVTEASKTQSGQGVKEDTCTEQQDRAVNTYVDPQDLSRELSLLMKSCDKKSSGDAGGILFVVVLVLPLALLVCNLGSLNLWFMEKMIMGTFVVHKIQNL